MERIKRGRMEGESGGRRRGGRGKERKEKQEREGVCACNLSAEEMDPP